MNKSRSSLWRDASASLAAYISTQMCCIEAQELPVGDESSPDCNELMNCDRVSDIYDARFAANDNSFSESEDFLFDMECRIGSRWRLDSDTDTDSDTDAPESTLKKEDLAEWDVLTT